IAFALPDGLAAAVKIEDGAARALPAVTVALLRRLGVGSTIEADVATLDGIASVPVLGGGRAVRHIRPVPPPWAKPLPRQPQCRAAPWAGRPLQPCGKCDHDLGVAGCAPKSRS